MTLCEIFNTCKNHLLTQNKKSLDEEGRCKYRGKDNCKCAIGIFIPDDEYNPEFDADCGLTLHKLHTPTIEKIFNTSKKLILGKRLQAIHDNYPVNEWPRILDKESLNYKTV